MEKDLTGQRFGKLVVLEKDKSRKGFVICKCDCGNIKSIRKTSLTKSKCPTRSCGCLQRKIAQQTGAGNIMENAKEIVEINAMFGTNFGMIENQEPPRNNTSGIKGVSFCKSRNRYEAYISVNGKRKSLGRFKNIEDAIEVRQEAEERYFKPLIRGKNAMLQSL